MFRRQRNRKTQVEESTNAIVLDDDLMDDLTTDLRAIAARYRQNGQPGHASVVDRIVNEIDPITNN
ncbi:hypothetical protein ACPXCE_09280 [Streptomyces sp. DT24]|uniref:hypothetical protein n=1 Tax=unclassified Streptomyces TaxID=2593676 RepID=UPI003CF0A496